MEVVLAEKRLTWGKILPNFEQISHIVYIVDFEQEIPAGKPS